MAFAELSADTERRIEAVLDPGLPAVNPLDAWGTGNRPHETFIACMHALVENEDTAALAFSLDLTQDLVPPEAYDMVSREVFAGTDKPVAVLANLVSAIDRTAAAHLRSLGVPVMEGTVTGLAAVRHLFAYRDFRARPPSDPPPPSGVAEPWRSRLTQARDLEPSEARSLLRDYGLVVHENPDPVPSGAMRAGVVTDKQFGPMVALGHRALASPPVDAPAAVRLIERAGENATDALVEAIVRLGRLASELGDVIGGIRVELSLDDGTADFTARG